MATGKRAFGYCDRTGKRYLLKDLRVQYVNGRPSGLMVGKDMLDIDHEQLRIGEVDASDDQSLVNARPDQNMQESRSLSAWDPVGGGVTEFGTRTVGLTMSGKIGQVRVEVA